MFKFYTKNKHKPKDQLLNSHYPSTTMLQGLYSITELHVPSSIVDVDYDSAKIYMKRDRAEHLTHALKRAFEKILKLQVNGLNYEELYRHGYYLTLHRHGAWLYSELNDAILHHLTSKVVPKISANMNSHFLEVLGLSWEQHHKSMMTISDVLIYMDRVFVTQNSLSSSYGLGVELFRNTVIYLPKIQKNLQDNLIRLVKSGRDGGSISIDILNTILNMLMSVGDNNRVVYEQIFETPLLSESARFFLGQSSQFLSKNDAAYYLRQTESLIEEEMMRSKQCYDSETTEKILHVAEEQLLRANMKEVIEMEGSGLVYMIEHQQAEDLARMYYLFSRVPEGLDTISLCTSFYLRHKGHEILNDEEVKSSAIDCVQNLMILKDHIDFYVTHSFLNDKNFTRQLATDLEYILNIDPKLPEYLSVFFDERLRKAAKGITQEERTVLLDKAVVLFRFIQDKDVFEQYYKQHLAKRLLSGKYLNEEIEKYVVIKFKEECGCHYTRKLEGMFNDIGTSTGETEEFRQFLDETDESTEGVDFVIKVLTAVFWPTYTVPAPCILPCAPATALDVFKKFYLTKRSGRQLTLLPQLGTAELETFLVPRDGQYCHSAQTQPCGEMRSYTLLVSTYQMCVLMLFNHRARWSFQELLSHTNISPKDLQRALQALTMGKSSQRVLVKQPDTRNVEPTDFFLINTAFTASKSKVKIPSVQVKYEFDSERQETAKRVNDDRQFEVDAAITRVMKAKRVMNHDSLINEVNNLLVRRFKPQKEVIKVRIESLIEREYIVRTPKDKRVYEYKPS